jgi:hypothetical protein
MATYRLLPGVFLIIRQSSKLKIEKNIYHCLHVDTENKNFFLFWKREFPVFPKKERGIVFATKNKELSGV